MAPIANDARMLEFLDRGKDITWITAASGWPARNIRGFADRHGWWFDEAGRPQRKPTSGADDGRPSPPTGDADVQVFRVQVNQLKPNPDNPRERFKGIEDLAASIRTVGLIQPIVVRSDPSGRYVIIAGHRRHAAIQQLGWTHVDVVLRESSRDDDLLQALIENGQRAGLDPIEEARAMNLLKSRHGLSDKAIGRRVGMSQPIVSGRIALLALPLHEQEQIRRGEMNLGDAVPRARAAAGTARGKSTGHPHLGIAHSLADRARSRCNRLGHKKRGRNRPHTAPAPSPASAQPATAHTAPPRRPGDHLARPEAAGPDPAAAARRASRTRAPAPGRPGRAQPSCSSGAVHPT